MKIYLLDETLYYLLQLNNMKTIWIISPSFWPWKYYPDRIKKCTLNAQKLWFKIKFLKNALNSNWYISDTPENRAKDFINAFLDKNIDIVMTMVWWNHSSQILKYVDWDIIKNNPKPFVWYSDISVLHHAIYTQTWLKTFYWPAFITQFWDISSYYKYTFDYFLKVLINNENNIEILESEKWTDDFVDWWDKTWKIKKFKLNNWYKWLNEWEVEWKIIWGCIPSINYLLWTKYFIDFQDKIFFIDIPEDYAWVDIWLTIWNLDAFLAQLDNIDFFQNIKGLIIWRPYRYSEEMNKKLEELIIYYTKWKKYPILLGADFWHTDPIITIKYNSNILLDSSNNSFILNFKK